MREGPAEEMSKMSEIEKKIEANKRAAFRTDSIVELRKLDRQLNNLRSKLALAKRQAVR